MNEQKPLGETEEIATDAEVNAAAEEAAASPKADKSDKKEKKESARLAEELKKKEEELSEAKDKYLRMMAEYDNYRKRSAKERDGIYTDAVSDVLAAMLPIADNLERAAQYKDEPEKVAEGLGMISKSLSELLAKFGVEQFGEAGDTFDPNLHNAIMHTEEEGYGEGEITEVFQRGYRKGDRIIRYAMVKVAVEE